MPHSTPLHRTEPDTIDGIVTDLRELRSASGSPSYAELGRRVGELRVERGVRPAAAVPARSTVYNLFKAGRVRMDHALLRDVVLALGESSETADGWVERCRRAHRVASPSPASASPAPEPAATSSHRAFSPRQLPIGATTAILLGCVLVNALGLAAQRALSLQVFLDMIGTGLAAIALGPWYGVLVAVASQAADVRNLGNAAELPFLLVSTAGALVWGYGVRRWRLGTNLSRYLLLNLLVALTCTTIVTPILVTLSAGTHGHLSDLFTGTLADSGVHLAAAVFGSNIIASMLDKLLSGLIMLALFVTLHRVVSVPADHMPVVEQLAALSARPAAPSAGVKTRRPDASE